MIPLMNQLMNDEAVYRTAPATPGLLKKGLFPGGHAGSTE